MSFAGYRVAMGALHAIGQQVASVAGVMHGITSVLLPSRVLRYTKLENPKTQSRVLKITNETMNRQEQEAADAVARFVKTVGLTHSLSGVGDEQIMRMVESSLPDTRGG